MEEKGEMTFLQHLEELKVAYYQGGIGDCSFQHRSIYL